MDTFLLFWIPLLIGIKMTAAALMVGHPPPRGLVQAEDDDLSWINEWNQNFSSTRETLGMDEAWFAVRSKSKRTFNLMYEGRECVGCPLKSLGEVPSDGVFTIKVSSKFGSRFALDTSGSLQNLTCELDHWLKQHGDYWLIVDDDDGDSINCHLLLANNPPNMFLPILYLFVILLGLIVIWITLSILYKKGYTKRLACWKTSVDLPTTENTNSIEMANGHGGGQNGKATGLETGKNESTQSSRRRLVSLDTFRGISLVIMIFVNFGGGGYYFFEHVPWNGLAVADLVFPWFVFMMGTSIAFSFRGMAKRQNPKGRICLRVAKRTALLFLIGISLNSSWYPFLSELRIPGVLQRLALTYFLTAVPQIFFATASNDYSGRLAVVSDIIQYWPEWIIHAIYLAVYLGLTFGLPVPGCPKGYLGPGGMHDGGAFFNCTGGAAGYIDRILLTNNHIYQWPTSKTIYHGTQAYDPEGILGTLSSSFTCFLGLQAGKILLHHKSHKGRLVRWTLWAITTGAIGVILCTGSVNDGWIPINKNLWSLSFALVIAATGYTCLILFYALTDLTQVWSGAPFLYPGMNSLVIYICHQSFGTYFPIRWKVEDVHWQALAMSAWATACWVIVAYVLYRKKIFVAL